MRLILNDRRKHLNHPFSDKRKAVTRRKLVTDAYHTAELMRDRSAQVQQGSLDKHFAGQTLMQESVGPITPRPSMPRSN